MYNCSKNDIKGHEFYNFGGYDITGHPTICMDAKMLTALKHLGHGCATNSWIDYFQMGQSTGCLCVETLYKCIAENTNLHE